MIQMAGSGDEVFITGFFILISSFFYLSSPMLVTPLITGFTESLGAGGAWMGVVGGLMNICALFCRPFVGNLADKMSNGIGYSCCSVCMSTWMSNLLPKEKIGSGMGMYGTMNALGMAVAPAIGVSLYGRIGYRAAFGVAAAFAVITAVMIQFVGDKGEPVFSAGSSQPQKIEWIDKKVIPIAVIIMLFAIPYCATQSFLVSYVEARKINVTVSLFFPLYAAVLLLLRLSLRNFFDKKPFSLFLLCSSVSALAGICLLAVMGNNVLLFLAAAFMAGGYGIMCSVCQSTAILLAGKEKRGLANSTYYIGLDLGMAFGPVIGGFLYGNVNMKYFYPIFMVTVPLSLAVYWINRNKFTQK